MRASKFLVVAQPPLAVHAAFTRALSEAGLTARLAGALFDPANWHQSLCDPCDDPRCIEPLRRACARVRVPACTLVLNRVRGNGRAGAWQWAFRARGMPAGFVELLTALNAARQAEGLPRSGGHTPHITVSYGAPGPLPSRAIRPIAWTIDEMRLVQGHVLNHRFVYELIERWPLQPPEPSPQRDLFLPGAGGA